MAFVAADLTALERAIADGVLRVRFADGREVTYQSVDALLRARGVVAGEVAAASPAGQDPTRMSGGVTYAEFYR